MPVNLTNPTTPIEAIYPIEGINIGVCQAEIRKKNRDDLCLFLLDEGASVAGVFTQNQCCAAPVLVCREHITSQAIRGLIINSGCANAATGEPGLADAKLTCGTLAKLINVEAKNILPFSTGVIMERLPMERMNAGIEKAYHQKSQKHASAENWLQAARAIMTTDTVAKIYSAKEGEIKVTGIAKGAGMIHPNMATMLGYMATNACIAPNVLQQLVREVADLSFNAVTVDGDTSTNDSFILIATNKAGIKINSTSDAAYNNIKALILSVAQKLAQAIVRDGEGAAKFVTVAVEGLTSESDAKKVAEKIALSPLIKTALFAGDPNLGRIFMAIGNAEVKNLPMSKVSLTIANAADSILVAEKGGRAATYTAAEESRALKIMQEAEFALIVNFHAGNQSFSKYTCDFGYEYVKINAEYRT